MRGSRQWNELRAQVAEEQGFLCWYCGIAVHLDKEGPLENRAAIDHCTPKRWSDDEDVRENLVVACNTCNCRKGRRSVEGFRQYLISLDPHARMARALDEFAVLRDLPRSGIGFRSWVVSKIPDLVFHGEKR